MAQDEGGSLSFVKPRLTKYKKVGCKEFVMGLSVIDIIMNNYINSVKAMIEDYELV